MRVLLLIYGQVSFIHVLRTMMHSCWNFDESHTANNTSANNISANIISDIRSWDIKERIVCVVRDNGANVIAGVRVAGLKSLPCLDS